MYTDAKLPNIFKFNFINKNRRPIEKLWLVSYSMIKDQLFPP